MLQAGACFARENHSPLLVEATSNQVNQDGGYTGQTPADFARTLRQITAAAGLPPQQVILGGDHLGPHPWKKLPAAQAMRRACQLAADSALAGYTKIHLDASMRCADDPPGPLADRVVAERAALMCAAAEAARDQLPDGSSLCYVIGTEVPPPGGAREQEANPQVTTPGEAQQTLYTFQRAFEARGLQAAWERVIALVVQPGVEFGDSSVHIYNRQTAAPLSKFIENYPGLVYEAHSTDYQPPQSLQEMVQDHFAILKVGPALTFAFREAVFALARVEQEWLESQPQVELSRLPETLEQVMLADDQNWRGYYQGDERKLRLARRYSYSDRSRYYWNHPNVRTSLQRLLSNLVTYPPPRTLLSQFLPEQYARLQSGRLAPCPSDWIADKINSVLAAYARACGFEMPGCL